MRKLLATSAIALLALTGCSGAPEPDDEAYLKTVRLLIDAGGLDANLIDGSDLVNLGYGLCEDAEKNGVTLDTMADRIADNATDEFEILAGAAIQVGAERHLCPDLK